MKKSEASTILALLNHLTGAQTLDEQDLLADLRALHQSAAAAFRGGALPLDDDALLDTLTQVAQRHADAGYPHGYFIDEPDDEPPARPIINPPINGHFL